MIVLTLNGDGTDEEGNIWLLSQARMESEDIMGSNNG